MKTRPRELTGLAMILLGVAASFPVQIMWLFGDSPLEWQAILAKLTPLNWAVIGLAILLVPLALRASLAFWIVAPAFLGSVLWNNWLVGAIQGDDWLSPSYLSSTGILLTFLGVLVSPACRRVLTHPRSRWWLTPPRHRVKLEARLCPVMGGEMASNTVDISEKGAFITFQDAHWREGRLRTPSSPQKSFDVGTYCWLRVALNEVSAFTCTAEVVRKTDPKGTYPCGIGLRFVGLTAREKKVLTGFLKTLDGKAAFDALVPALPTQQKNAA